MLNRLEPRIKHPGIKTLKDLVISENMNIVKTDMIFNLMDLYFVYGKNLYCNFKICKQILRTKESTF